MEQSHLHALQLGWPDGGQALLYGGWCGFKTGCCARGRPWSFVIQPGVGPVGP